MARSILAIDSAYEPVTEAAFAYREQNVYPTLGQDGLTIVRCQGMLARRYYFEQEAAKPEVGYVTGVGHGEYDRYMGDFQNEILTVGEYDPALVRGKIFHFLSCQTALRLGPDLVQNGCLAYFGYDENFAFFLDGANAFFDCDSQIDLALAEGKTAREAHQRAIALYDKYIADFIASGQTYTAAVFEYNRDRLRSPVSGPSWGSPDASL